MKCSAVVNGVRERELDHWREFSGLVENELLKAPAYVYRGQANSAWRIESTLNRLRAKYPKRKNLEDNPNPEWFARPPLTNEEHLEAFKRAVRGRRGPNPPQLTDDDYWVLGQHHGLVTPLLD